MECEWVARKPVLSFTHRSRLKYILHHIYFIFKLICVLPKWLFFPLLGVSASSFTLVFGPERRAGNLLNVYTNLQTNQWCSVRLDLTSQPKEAQSGNSKHMAKMSSWDEWQMSTQFIASGFCLLDPKMESKNGVLCSLLSAKYLKSPLLIFDKIHQSARVILYGKVKLTSVCCCCWPSCVCFLLWISPVND